MINERPDIAIPLAPSTKRQVPKYIATKFFVVASIASPWFAACVAILARRYPDYAVHAAVGCFAMALVISVVAAWSKFAEQQEDKLFEDLRR